MIPAEMNDASQPSLVNTESFVWPMRGHDAQNTGQSEFVASQNEGYEKWKYFVQYGLEEKTPVIDGNGTIYIAADMFNGLFAIYPNGTIKWYTGMEADWICQPIIGLDGTIYVGNADGFYAFYENNGTLRWTAPIEDDAYGPPVMSPEGTLYVGAADYYLYAISPNGTIQWNYYVGYSNICPALDTKGNIYFTAHYSGYLYCLNPNGMLRWTFKIYSDTYDAPLISDDGTIYVTTGSYVYAINSDGTLKWQTFIDIIGYGPSLSPDGTIVYSSMGKDVFGLDPVDGHIQWQYQLNFNPTDKSRPAISSDGIIFFAYTDESGYNVYLSALNPDGSLKWTTSVTSDIYPYHTAHVGPMPSIAADGTVYVTTWFWGTPGGYVHAFGQLDPNAPTAPTITGPPKGNVGEPYEYTFTSTSPMGKNLSYFVYWDDVTYTNWTGPFSSGEPIHMNHTWAKRGTYTIQAKARDSDNLWGLWGELEITMPYSYEPQFPFIHWLLERFPNAFPILRYLLGCYD